MVTGTHLWGQATHLGGVLRDLDDDARDKIRPVLENQAETIKPLRREMWQAQKEFRKLLVEESFDEGALEESLSQLRHASEEYQTGMHHQMLLVLKDLEPEQRRRVARYLMRSRPEGRDRESRDRESRDRRPRKRE
jgi:Spy/CpxP family protein refolding chaperone